MSTDLIVRGLTIYDGAGTALVRDIEFSLPAGGILTIIGESGGGKSLIAQALMGLLPTGFRAVGTVLWRGGIFDLGRPEALHGLWASDFLLVPQEPGAALDPTQRLGQMLAQTGQTPAPIQESLAAVDLPASSAAAYPFQLSGGMAQRAVMASALRLDAPLLIADEPTKGLDSERLDDVADLLLRMAQRGRTLLLISHDRHLVRRLGGSLLVLADGQVQEVGPSDAVLTHPQSAYTRAWLAADPATWVPCPACATDAPLVLAAHGLSLGYPGTRDLLSNVDIHLTKGMILGVSGPSGCGKTSLGNSLLGLLPPRSGSVSWGGFDPYRDPASARRLRRRYQKLHQDPTAVFAPHRPLHAQFRDLNALAPQPDYAERLAAGLDRLKLNSTLLHRFPSEISGGEAQRLALLRLLLLNPAVIVADEPTSRLDPISQKETIALLHHIAIQDKVGLIIISHDKEILDASSDHVFNFQI
ncbi:ABC transporter ATP-binding protein [Elstera sp.]|jgi:peptide/nickel transport system ATP-binding protein|uniref:ABC transporter ATP-binding protein n=1 Tax=Elstera sp. TaxID=1916664 RepID=UPI0037BF004D